MTETVPAVDSRERILRAAQDLHSRRCFEKISVRDIADKAEVNPALIYYYFQDKAALRDAMFEELFGRLFSDIAAGLATRSASWDKLRYFAECFVGNIAQYRQIHRIVLHGVVAVGECRPPLVARHMGALHGLLNEIVTGGVASGEFDTTDPATVSQFILGALVHLTTNPEWFAIDHELLDEPVKRRVLDQFERLFRSGLEKRIQGAGHTAGRRVP